MSETSLRHAPADHGRRTVTTLLRQHKRARRESPMTFCFPEPPVYSFICSSGAVCLSVIFNLPRAYKERATRAVGRPSRVSRLVLGAAVRMS